MYKEKKWVGKNLQWGYGFTKVTAIRAVMDPAIQAVI